jgi:SAM-dependent methyltransferase
METVACDLCGSDRYRTVLRQGDLTHAVSADLFTVVRCLECGLHYLNPRPTPAEISKYYPDRYYPSQTPRSLTGLERSAKRFSRGVKRWIMEDFYGYPGAGPRRPWHALRKMALWPELMRRRWRGREILPWVGAGRLLDVGCGPGGNLAVFQEQGWDVYGIEFSDAAVAQARARVGDRIHAGTLDTAPYREESFDVIVLSHSLEHFFSPSATLKRLGRLLAPQGRIVIAVPNAGGLEARLFGPSWMPWELPRHLFHFTPVTLGRLLEKCGLRVVRFRTGVGSLYFMASLERYWSGRYEGPLPLKRLVEKAVARPVCLLAGHLGRGTEIVVHAVKQG